ncbi:hypothetical protein [Chlorobaculum limnaeum]|uniref:hypothetical protein n=1 Tax=Chlorobaculum limnaeum TaxID=274537 RepID=UPI001969B48B|nr:hypothetical protein [Chlorobaculum limnaeum]
MFDTSEKQKPPERQEVSAFMPARQDAPAIQARRASPCPIQIPHPRSPYKTTLLTSQRASISIFRKSSFLVRRISNIRPPRSIQNLDTKAFEHLANPALSCHKKSRSGSNPGDFLLCFGERSERAT